MKGYILTFIFCVFAVIVIMLFSNAYADSFTRCDHYRDKTICNTTISDSCSINDDYRHEPQVQQPTEQLQVYTKTTTTTELSD